MAAQWQKWNERKPSLTHSDVNCLNTVRTLHKTVVDLRTALERSRSELHRLKLPVETSSRCSNTIEKLSLENHILRQKFLSTKEGKLYKEKFTRNIHEPVKAYHFSMCDLSKENFGNKSGTDKNEMSLIIDEQSDNKVDCSGEKGTNTIPEENILEKDNRRDCENFFIKEDSFVSKTDSEESEVDDIELIFTNDDTKEILIQGELESISDYDSKPEINSQGILTQSVLVETDISKCGIVYDIDTSHLCPHKPIIIKPGENFLRPILNDNNLSAVRDSEAQTDISALPPYWRSESFLAGNKGANNITTLPSKFAIRAKENSRKKHSLKLCDKTKEARRVLLSDINFTSMVPELSRSVDHLCQKRMNEVNDNLEGNNSGTLTDLKSHLTYTSGSSQSKFDLGNSSLDWNENSVYYEQNPSIQRSRPSVFSLDACYLPSTSSVPPSPTQRRHSSSVTSCYPSNLSRNYFAYSCPLNIQKPHPLSLKSGSAAFLQRKQKLKVTFKDLLGGINIRQSLPNVFVEDSEDSTESLINESENAIRESIDAIATGKLRTFSESDLIKDFSVPLSAKPFIPRSPSNLHINDLVKVINTDRRIIPGKVQYVGVLPGNSDYHVGLVLFSAVGDNDGCYKGYRYFTCDRNYGIFVPFRKVVMAWKIYL